MDREIIALYLGPMGAGKTNAIKSELREDDPGRVIILDAKLEYEAYGTICTSPDHLFHLTTDADGVLKDRFHVVIRGNLRNEELVCAYWRMIAGEENGEGGMLDATVVVDEAHRYCKPNHCPDDLEEVIRFQRHNGQRLIFATQLPGDLWRGLRGVANEVHCWQYTEPTDLDYTKRWICAEDLSTLRPFERHIWIRQPGGKPHISRKICPEVIDKPYRYL